MGIEEAPGAQGNEPADQPGEGGFLIGMKNPTMTDQMITLEKSPPTRTCCAR
jgi:hypothetical protein